MQSRDDVLVEVFVRTLNEIEGTSLEIAERPDQTERNRPAIEAVAQDRSSGTTMRIEHTRLEPFEGEGADFGRLREIAEAIEGNASLVHPNRELDISFAVGAFEIFSKWARDKARVSREIIKWLEDNSASFSTGYREYSIAVPEEITVGVGVAQLSGAGGVRVARRNPPDSLSATVRRAVERKITKLIEQPASRHVLLLEKYIPIHSGYDFARELSELVSEFPELKRIEAWIVDTNGWHWDETIGIYQVWPRLQHKARWISGGPEVKLPHRRHLQH